jgi:hypothetical protein
MAAPATLQPIVDRSTWRGDDQLPESSFVYVLSNEELAEIEAVGAQLLADDPDVGSVEAHSYPLPVTSKGIAEWGEQLDHGLGFVLVRGLRVEQYSRELSSAIFLLLGLHLGAPMRQNAAGDVITHVIATTDKSAYEPGVLSSRTTSALTFHSDSSDIVGLMCLHGARAGGESVLASGTTVYNEVLKRRPDLAPLMFESFHWDWRKQDFKSPTVTYESPMCSYVDGVFSMYGGSKIVFTAQDYPEVPRLTEQQKELLALVDQIAAEPGIGLEMDFRAGDIQWLLNHTAMHSRHEYWDWPEPDRRRHLIRLWLKRDGRPMVPGFGKPVRPRQSEEPMKRPHISDLVEVTEDEQEY